MQNCKQSKVYGHKRRLASMVAIHFGMKAGGTSTHTETRTSENQELAIELHSHIATKYKRRKCGEYWSYWDNICDVNLADMQSINNTMWE